jgi:hypothetical protein
VYLLEQFLGYLKTRGIIMDPVSWELARGARALYALLAMLAETAAACKVQPQPTQFGSTSEFTGFWLDRKRYFFGVRFDSADVVRFHTREVRIDRQATEKLGFGRVWEANYVRGGLAWHDDLNLASVDVDFFARSLASQQECLEQFLTRCLEAVKKLEIPELVDSSPTERPESAGDGEPGEPEIEAEDNLPPEADRVGS